MKFNIKLLLDVNILIFLLSFIPLVVAYISQYFFSLQPCNLCIYQRIAFFVILFLSIFSIIFIKNLKYQNYFTLLAILLFFVNMILALYHVGVEKKIFKLPESCDGGNILEMTDIAKLTDFIMSKSAVKCDEAAFEILGISMAGMNVIYCLFAIILIILVKNGFFKSK